MQCRYERAAETTQQWQVQPVNMTVDYVEICRMTGYGFQQRGLCGDWV